MKHMHELAAAARAPCRSARAKQKKERWILTPSKKTNKKQTISTWFEKIKMPFW